MLNDPTRNNQTDSEYGIVYRKSKREQWNRMRSCCFITSGVPLVKYETEPFTQRACMQSTKEKNHSRLTGGRFNRERNLPTRLVLGGHKTSQSPHPLIRILKIGVRD